jgi:hypothetical protein
MATLSIPENEMTSFDLPKVCIVTGSRQNVAFRPVKFQWYPRWIGGFAIAPLIMIVLMMVLMRRAKGELPFTDEAWEAWRKGKLLMALGSVGAIVLAGAGIAALANRLEAVGAVLLLAAVALPIVIGVKFLMGRGPTCTKIADGRIELKIKSETAAQEIQRHLEGGSGKSASAAA